MNYLDYLEPFMNLETALIALCAVSGLSFAMALSANFRTVRKQINKPMIATSDRQQALSTLAAQIKDLEANIQSNENTLAQQNKKIMRSNIVRYNPFKDSGVGGLQSFSLAQVDQHGNGSIVTHLFSREMSRVQARQITDWQSDQELSPEEKQAIEELKNK